MADRKSQLLHRFLLLDGIRVGRSLLTGFALARPYGVLNATIFASSASSASTQADMTQNGQISPRIPMGLPYSHRKATIGSTCAAERAGISVAISATAISASVTATKLKGSRDPTP